jgi:hypothetical protein
MLIIHPKNSKKLQLFSDKSVLLTTTSIYIYKKRVHRDKEDTFLMQYVKSIKYRACFSVKLALNTETVRSHYAC